LQPLPKWAQNEIKNLIYKFIWRGLNRFPRETLIREVERGLNLPLLSHIDMTLRTSWINKTVKTSHIWKEYLEEMERPEVLIVVSRAGGKGKYF